MVLGIKPRVSFMVGKCCTTELYPSAQGGFTECCMLSISLDICNMSASKVDKNPCFSGFYVCDAVSVKLKVHWRPHELGEHCKEGTDLSQEKSHTSYNHQMCYMSRATQAL